MRKRESVTEGKRGTGIVSERGGERVKLSLAISPSFVAGQANNRCGVCAPLFLATPHCTATLPLRSPFPLLTIDLCKY